MFRPKDKQPRLSIFFYGKNKSWLKTCLALWCWCLLVRKCLDDDQRLFRMDWKKLKTFVTDEKLEGHVLLLSNPEAHIPAEFSEAINKLSGIVCYGFLNATDFCQPLDAGYAQVLEVLIEVQYDIGSIAKIMQTDSLVTKIDILPKSEKIG